MGILTFKIQYRWIPKRANHVSRARKRRCCFEHEDDDDEDDDEEATTAVTTSAQAVNVESRTTEEESLKAICTIKKLSEALTE